jgi:hypothetical protein
VIAPGCKVSAVRLDADARNRAPSKNCWCTWFLPIDILVSSDIMIAMLIVLVI